MRCLLVIAIAGSFSCGQKAEPSEPGASAQDPAASPAAAECAAAADCVVTSLPETPMTRAEDCCVPLCEKRVATKKEADELQAAYGAQCAAVQCPAHECAKQEEPVPACRDGQCVAGP